VLISQARVPLIKRTGGNFSSTEEDKAGETSGSVMFTSRRHADM
jgi:hypothetical protein